MRTVQSGTRGGDFCLHKPVPLWLSEHTCPSPLKTAFPSDVSPEQDRPAQARVLWPGEEQSRKDQGRPDHCSANQTSEEQSGAV